MTIARALLPALSLAAFGLLAGCRAAAPRTEGVLVAHLGRAGNDRRGFETLRARFERAHRDCQLEFGSLAELAPCNRTRILFVCEGRGRAGVRRGGTQVHSELAVGDAIVLRPGAELSADPSLRAVGFRFGAQPSPGIPTFLRPDADPKILDAPGGCAPESGAYRRLLLTWLAANGPYTYQELNAHRVRIVDSPTHYHPLEGGFDEFYLVESTEPGASLFVSHQVPSIEAESVSRAEASTLFETIALEPGDLVYLPRGTIHRGVGGILTQVIAVPGFVPGGEIVVDTHLSAINVRLELAGDAALPVHATPGGSR